MGVVVLLKEPGDLDEMNLGPDVFASPNSEKLTEPEFDGVLLNGADDCLQGPF